MLIRTEQSIRFCCGLRVDHSLDNYILQNGVQFCCPHFLIEGASDTSPTMFNCIFYKKQKFDSYKLITI